MLKKVLDNGGSKYIYDRSDETDCRTMLEYFLFSETEGEFNDRTLIGERQRYIDYIKADDKVILMRDDFIENDPMLGMSLSIDNIIREKITELERKNFQEKIELQMNNGGDFKIIQGFLKQDGLKERVLDIYQFLSHIFIKQAQFNKTKQNQGC